MNTDDEIIIPMKYHGYGRVVPLLKTSAIGATCGFAMYLALMLFGLSASQAGLWVSATGVLLFAICVRGIWQTRKTSDSTGRVLSVGILTVAASMASLWIGATPALLLLMMAAAFCTSLFFLVSDFDSVISFQIFGLLILASTMVMWVGFLLIGMLPFS